VRFGLRLVQHVGPAPELVRLAALADASGFDAVWFPHDPFMKHAWVMAAAVAGQTSAPTSLAAARRARAMCSSTTIVSSVTEGSGDSRTKRQNSSIAATASGGGMPLQAVSR